MALSIDTVALFIPRRLTARLNKYFTSFTPEYSQVHKSFTNKSTNPHGQACSATRILDGTLNVVYDAMPVRKRRDAGSFACITCGGIVASPFVNMVPWGWDAMCDDVGHVGRARLGAGRCTRKRLHILVHSLAVQVIGFSTSNSQSLGSAFYFNLRGGP